MARKPGTKSHLQGEPIRLHVFISYASEDAVLAQAINTELKTAFGEAIMKTTLDSELKLGTEWQLRLVEELNRADILLIIATGRQKLSHSYTGFEVGFFQSVRRRKKWMKHFKSERLLVPIGDLGEIPTTLSHIQGLNVKGQLIPLIGNNSAENPFLRLFVELNDLIRTNSALHGDGVEKFKEKATQSAKRLYRCFLLEFHNRVVTETFHERKIVVQFSTDAAIGPQQDLPESTTIEFFGGPFEMFGIYTRQEKTSFANFMSGIRRADTITAWNDIIKSLIIAAKEGSFSDNRRLLASSDRKRFFRLFVSKSVIYPIGITELHIYVVEVKSRDYGDPATTMLLKAISVGLMYRFLFLEEESQFSPRHIRATLTRDLQTTVSELLQELDYILWISTDAGLSKAGNLLIVYGDFEEGELEKRFDAWRKRKDDLSSCGHQVLRASSDHELAEHKRAFEHSLASFCELTRDMNTEFLDNVLRAIQGIVLKSNVSAPKISVAAQ